MTRPKLRLIEGGIKSKEHAAKTFLAAAITDTRLMGATALYLHWRLEDCGDVDSLHQFFYFDDEEFSFETYRSIWGDDDEELLELEQALMGGLGGKKVDLTQREATFLVYKYAQKNLTLGIPLPENESEYRFLLEKPPGWTSEEWSSLRDKICTPIRSNWHGINYFLMRCFGKDFEGAGFLTQQMEPPKDPFEELPQATLCRNVINPGESNRFLCESLLEVDHSYRVVVSNLWIQEGRVIDCCMVSSMTVSPAEAAMMLSRSEYVTVYDILMGPDEFDEKSWCFSVGAMVTLHENGRLFLTFNSNNNHVNKRIFRLSDDIFGLYFVTDFGQLILSASTLKNIQSMESKLAKGPLKDGLQAGSRYEFKEPVLYEFIQSDFDDFDDYVTYLNPDGQED